MTERQKLYATVDQQITELIDLIRTLDQPALRRPCAGREKLGDGTVAACAQHTAHNYQRIGTFIATADRTSAGHAVRQRGAPDSTIPPGAGPPGGGAQPAWRGQSPPHEPYTAENTSPADLIEQLPPRARTSPGCELTDRHWKRSRRRTASGSATGSARSSRYSLGCSSIKPTSSRRSRPRSPERR